MDDVTFFTLYLLYYVLLHSHILFVLSCLPVDSCLNVNDLHKYVRNYLNVLMGYTYD